MQELNSFINQIKTEYEEVSQEAKSIVQEKKTTKDLNINEIAQKLLKINEELGDVQKKFPEKSLSFVLNYQDKINALAKQILPEDEAKKIKKSNAIRIIKTFSSKRDVFSKHYSIVSTSGLSAGGNGSVERIVVKDKQGRIGYFALKTPQILITTLSAYIESQIPGITKDGPMSFKLGLGWDKCTQREKLKIYQLFGENDPKSEIKSIEALEKSVSDEQIKELREQIFGSQEAGADRVPDIYLKAWMSFGRKCFEDTREEQREIAQQLNVPLNLYPGEDDIIKEALIYHQLETTHPNILDLISYGAKPINNQEVGGKYIVMELAQDNLYHFLQSHPDMPLTEKVHYLAQIAAGVAHLNQQGIIHRDLKLNNILLGYDGNMKVADFGVATLIGKETGVPGNPQAIPPEFGLENQTQEKYDSWGLAFMIMNLISQEDQVDDLFKNLDPLLMSYRNSLKVGSSESQILIEEMIKKFLTTGNDGTHGDKPLSLNHILSSKSAEARDEKILKSLQKIVLKLLEPDASKRMSTQRAANLLRSLDKGISAREKGIAKEG